MPVLQLQFNLSALKMSPCEVAKTNAVSFELYKVFTLWERFAARFDTIILWKVSCEMATQIQSISVFVTHVSAVNSKGMNATLNAH